MIAPPRTPELRVKQLPAVVKRIPLLANGLDHLTFRFGLIERINLLSSFLRGLATRHHAAADRMTLASANELLKFQESPFRAHTT
jgi:hypothetical protein